MARLVVLTSVSLRHEYFVKILAKDHEVVLACFEAKAEFAPKVKTNPLVREHFRQRDEAEQRYFGPRSKLDFPVQNRRVLSHGQINTPQMADRVIAARPDWVILFGSSIIKDPLLTHFRGRILNLHLGLSPYYRGAGTNFWPLVNGEPECVGATCHYAVLKVDAGEILGQARPEIAPGDGPHDLGCKTIVAGAALMSQAIVLADRNAISGRLQTPEELKRGKLYTKADFTPAAIKRMRDNFCRGMIEKYLAAKAERDAKFPIVELPYPDSGKHE